MKYRHALSQRQKEMPFSNNVVKIVLKFEFSKFTAHSMDNICGMLKWYFNLIVQLVKTLSVDKIKHITPQTSILKGLLWTCLFTDAVNEPSHVLNPLHEDPPQTNVVLTLQIMQKRCQTEFCFMRQSNKRF